MFDTILKELSLNDLIKELFHKEKQLSLSRLNKADNHLIKFNKDQLEKVQQAIIDKTGCDLPIVQ